MAKQIELLLLSKTLVQPSFSDVFFRFQPSLTTISNVFFLMQPSKRLFTTISDDCNSLCKPSSSTILRPGLYGSSDNIGVCNLLARCVDDIQFFHCKYLKLAFFNFSNICYQTISNFFCPLFSFRFCPNINMINFLCNFTQLSGFFF